MKAYMWIYQSVGSECTGDSQIEQDNVCIKYGYAWVLIHDIKSLKKQGKKRRKRTALFIIAKLLWDLQCGVKADFEERRCGVISTNHKL